MTWLLYWISLHCTSVPHKVKTNKLDIGTRKLMLQHAEVVDCCETLRDLVR